MIPLRIFAMLFRDTEYHYTGVEANCTHVAVRCNQICKCMLYYVHRTSLKVWQCLLEPCATHLYVTSEAAHTLRMRTCAPPPPRLEPVTLKRLLCSHCGSLQPPPPHTHTLIYRDISLYRHAYVYMYMYTFSPTSPLTHRRY